MSGSASITRRNTSKGTRYEVRYRLGGRAHPVRSAGRFKTERDAKERLRFVAGELAAGRDPALSLAEAFTAKAKPRTLDEWFGMFITSRIDVTDTTLKSYRNAREKLGTLAHRDPATLTPADFQQAIADNSDLASRTLGHYVSTWAQVMDFADIEPNPARSPKVKLPTGSREEIAPPSGDEWAKIRKHIGKRLDLIVRLIECDALRVTEALSLTWGDIDFDSERIRISRARTKGRTAGQRWLPVPTVILDEIEGLLPFEDRTRDRRVFRDISDDAIRNRLYKACSHAGVASYSPHDLRHRRISLWFAHGFDQITIKTWAGHSKASMSSDVYGHVIVDPAADEWREFWIQAYRRERLPAVSEYERERS